MSLIRTLWPAAAFAALLGVLVIATPWSSYAHLRNSDGQYYVGGRTLNDEDQKEDPINVVFQGAEREVPSALMIDDWDEPGGDMNSVLGGTCGFAQAIYYKHPRIRDDEEDLAYKERCLADTYHIRLWDSKEHDDSQPEPHADDRFAVMGVHRDDCCPDSVNTPWEVAERRMIDALSEWCSWHNNRRLPGSKGQFEEFYSNGRASRIAPVAISDPGRC